MGFVELLLIAVGLAMDSFTVSICKGLGMRKVNVKTAVVLALFMGGFQALMPLIGWILGSQFLEYIEPIDHWIAFVLLAIIGGKMIYEAIRGDDDDEEESAENAEKINLGEFTMLGIATSIDALTMGVSFAALSVNIWEAITLIGVVAFAFSFAGVYVGYYTGSRWRKPASITGGCILILIGVKVLLEHLGIIA